MPLLMGLAYAI